MTVGNEVQQGVELPADVRHALPQLVELRAALAIDLAKIFCDAGSGKSEAGRASQGVQQFLEKSFSQDVLADAQGVRAGAALDVIAAAVVSR